MKSSAVLKSRQERTAGSTSHIGSSKAVSGSSAILVGGSSCVFMATPSSDAANHTALQRAPLLYHLVGAAEHRLWHGQAHRLRGFEVDYQLILGRCLYGKVRRFLALEDAVDVPRRAAELIEKIRPVRDQSSGSSV